MPEAFSLDKSELNLVSELEETEGRPEPETPFRVALLGDWSGRANRHQTATGRAADSFRALELDRDNFEEVLARLDVRLRLFVGNEDDPGITLEFKELDDFHPDRIFERLEVFEALRQLRQRLGSRETFAEAAEEVRGWTRLSSAGQATEAGRVSSEEDTEQARSLPTQDSGSLLDQLLEEAETSSVAAPRKQSSGPDDLQALVQNIVRPHLIEGEDPQQPELIASVDEATGRLMRSILHHADFQALESAWRALYFLVSRLETGTQLKLYLLDLSKDELVQSLNSMDDLQSSGIYRLLVEETTGTLGGVPWAVLAANYTFDLTLEEIELLSLAGLLARLARAPFIAAASPHFLGCHSLASTPDPDDWQRPVEAEAGPAWQALRQQPEAAYLGLALPRFLVRLPYGAETEPTERFDFEEMAEGASHESYLWANPSFGCAYLLAHAFSLNGWEMRPGIVQEIEGLPLHVYREEGESRVKPCAETLFTMRAAEQVLNQGLMPLLSFRDSDTIRLGLFQSIAGTALKGRWS
ncbi:MAG TPA: type VI secretion system contractile sheath large subunit [Pyrinomonadaceae bacterium]|jgi:type VI secretion system protein ImpC